MEVAAKDMGVDLEAKKDPQLLQALRDQAERGKISLSSSESAEFVLGGYRRTFTRAEFEALIASHIDRSLAKCRNALRDAELKADQIDEVVLVGGSTRILYV